jgi:hypothetical protein
VHAVLNLGCKLHPAGSTGCWTPLLVDALLHMLQAQAAQKGRAQKPKREAVQLEGLLNIMAVLEAAEVHCTTCRHSFTPAPSGEVLRGNARTMHSTAGRNGDGTLRMQRARALAAAGAMRCSVGTFSLHACSSLACLLAAGAHCRLACSCSLG